MAEKVETGGVKRFVYDKSNESKLDEERKEGIREAYERYEKRVEDDKRKRMLWIIIIFVLILLGISLYFSFR